MQHAFVRDSSVNLSSITVGIIEPQRLFAPYLAQLLTKAGLCVVVALESVALEDIARNDPAVVIVDVDFIDVDPVTAIRRLRGVVPNATVCAYTGRSDVGWAATCSRAGANCVLSKSASPAEIVEGIHHALRVGAFIDYRFERNDAKDSSVLASQGESLKDL